MQQRFDLFGVVSGLILPAVIEKMGHTVGVDQGLDGFRPNR